MYKILTLIIFVLFLAEFSCSSPPETPKLFAGGFTKENEKGLFLFDFDKKGNLSLLAQSDAGPSPSYFCFFQKHNLIYALDEVMDFNGKPGGGITTLQYDQASGAIEKRNELPVPYGGPCHISVSTDSCFLFVASYGSGSVAVVKLDEMGIPERVTDSVLYVTEAPKVSHPHMILQDPAGKHVYLTDLGLDRIIIYDFDRSIGRLVQLTDGIISLPDGSGPRHFVFKEDGSKMYVINELGSTIIVFDIDEKGLLHPVQSVPTTREGFQGKNFCAEILVGKSGDFLYGSNRGENSIVIYKIEEDGLLSLAGHSSCGGDWPRNFVIDPSGKFLLSGNQRSGWISVYNINQITGLPEGPVGKVEMNAPAYLEFWQ